MKASTIKTALYVVAICIAIGGWQHEHEERMREQKERLVRVDADEIGCMKLAADDNLCVTVIDGSRLVPIPDGGNFEPAWQSIRWTKGSALVRWGTHWGSR